MVRLHDYSNKELLDRGDEISLAMMINKIRCLEDMEAFSQIPNDQVNRIIKDTPEYLLGIMEKMMRALFYSMNLEEEKMENAVSKIKERKMGRLFEGVTFDFQAARKELEEAAAEAKAEREEAEAEMEAAKAETEAAKAEMEAAKAEKEAARAETEAAKAETEVMKTELEITRCIAQKLISGCPEAQIVKFLQQKFGLTEEQAKENYERAVK